MFVLFCASLIFSCSNETSDNEVELSSNQRSFELYKSETSNLLSNVNNTVNDYLGNDENIINEQELYNEIIDQLSDFSVNSELYKSIDSSSFLSTSLRNPNNSLQNLNIEFQSINYFSPLAKSYSTQLITLLENQDGKGILELYNQYLLDYNTDLTLEVFAPVFASIKYFENDLLTHTKSNCEIDGTKVILGGLFSGLATALKGGTGGSLFGPVGTVGGFVGGFIAGFTVGAIGSIGTQGIACELRR